MNIKNKKLLILIIVIALLLIGIILACFWLSKNSRKTAIIFTETEGFSCSADSGGNITNSKQLLPTDCTDKKYAIKKAVNVGSTIGKSHDDVYLELWLKVNAISSSLTGTQNFKYAFTTSATSCMTGVQAEGNFSGVTTDTKLSLLHNKAYSKTTSETYYLWIWLDKAEANNIEDTAFDITLDGVCTNQVSGDGEIYTANIYNEEDSQNNIITIGDELPSGVTTYNIADGAMTALRAAGSDSYSDYLFHLKHTLSDNIVKESYVGFVITDDIAKKHTNLTAGTYYLKGGSANYYDDNMKVLAKAFGDVSKYCTKEENYIECSTSNFDVDYYFKEANLGVYSKNGRNGCSIDNKGKSFCFVYTH